MNYYHYVCPLCINYYNHYHGNTVKGFSTLQDNVYMTKCVQYAYLTIISVQQC
jgi:hypothetical protein